MRRKKELPNVTAEIWLAADPPTTQAAIEIYIGTSTKPETVIDLKVDASEQAQQLAAFIKHALNTYASRDNLIEEMAFALDACIESKGNPDWATEFDAEIILSRARKRERFMA